MQLENRFTIGAPIGKAWEALNTPETIAPCFPGATLTEYEGDSFAGTVKVKLGPISLTYKGKGAYVSRDDTAYKVVIEANGRDSRGNGTASATVTATMVADGQDRTAVTMVTDMTITGRPAQFGRGVISDVADKIIGQFAGCVAGKLAPEPGAASTGVGAASPAAAGGSSNGAAAGAGTTTVTAISTGPVLASPPPSSSGATAPQAVAPQAVAPQAVAPQAVAPQAVARPPEPMQSEIDAIDLLDTAGAPALKRLAPVIGGALLLLIVILVRRRRSS